MGLVEFSVQGQQARLTLDNERKANALTFDMLKQISKAIETIEEDASIRVLVLDSKGDRFFCAGADIKEWGELSSPEMGTRWIRYGSEVFDRLSRLDIPVIAAIHGAAIGGGLELAMMADIRIASDTSKFSLPEASIGAIPGWMGCNRLQELVGRSLARRMILFGDTLSAAEAEAAHLVDVVCPAESLESEVSQRVDKVLARSPHALSIAKRVLNASEGLGTEKVLHELAASAARATADADEGVAAFKAKRQPDYS